MLLVVVLLVNVGGVIQLSGSQLWLIMSAVQAFPSKLMHPGHLEPEKTFVGVVHYCQ